MEGLQCLNANLPHVFARARNDAGCGTYVAENINPHVCKSQTLQMDKARMSQTRSLRNMLSQNLDSALVWVSTTR